jgi:hypothetical protein
MLYSNNSNNSRYLDVNDIMIVIKPHSFQEKTQKK